MECVSSKGETSAIVQSSQLFAWKVHDFAAHRELSDRRDTQDRWFAHPHPAGRKSDPRLARADPLSPPHPTPHLTPTPKTSMCKLRNVH
jgi:hypothetical protein